MLVASVSFVNAFIFRNPLLIFIGLSALAGFSSVFPDLNAKNALFYEPTWNILGFSALLMIAYLWPWASIYKNLRQAFLYGCLFFINLAFFIGTITGDILPLGNGFFEIKGYVFTIIWTFLLTLGIFLAWQGKHHRLCHFFVAFASIHFYVEFFRHAAFSAGSLVLAGLLGLGLALLLTRLNHYFFDTTGKNT